MVTAYLLLYLLFQDCIFRICTKKNAMELQISLVLFWGLNKKLYFCN